MVPKLAEYTVEEQHKNNKMMAIGCMSEVFKLCPAASVMYFDDFIQVLLNNSSTDQSSLNRNVSYGLGVLAENASADKFQPHLKASLSAIKVMYDASEDEGAKDNCTASMAKIFEKYQQTLTESEFEECFAHIMSQIPLKGDPAENETMLKLVMSVNSQNPTKLGPHMERVVLLTLNILTSEECRKTIEEPFKVMTAQYIKNVICADQ